MKRNQIFATRRLTTVIACLASLALTAPSNAQDLVRIAAVVNDDVISVLDMNARINMALATAGLQGTQDMRRQLAAPVLRALVDEKLQLQEAERQGVTISETELNDALAAVERQNGLDAGGLDAYLGRLGVPVSTLVEQLRAQLSWSKFISQRLRPTVIVSNEEIEEELAQLKASEGKPEYLISEIDLYVDNQSDEAEVLKTANRLVQQLREGGNFRAIAQQFSQGSMASRGGDVGWIQIGQLRGEIDEALQKLDIGEFAGPIRSLEGFHIIHLRDRRQVAGASANDARVRLAQVLLPRPQPDTPDTLAVQVELARTVSETVDGCPDMDRVAEELSAPSSGDIGWLRVDDLPVSMRTEVANAAIGKPTEPITTDAGVHVLMVCEREDSVGIDAQRQTIYDRLETQRLEVIARRLLRDLRRVAFVDLRV